MTHHKSDPYIVSWISRTRSVQVENYSSLVPRLYIYISCKECRRTIPEDPLHGVLQKKKKERRSTYTQYNIDKKDRRWSNLNILCSALLDLLWRQISTRQTPPIYPNNPQVLCHMIQWLQQFFNVARTCPCNCISHGSSSLPYAISLSRVLAPIASCDSSIIHPAGISSRPCPSSFLYRSVQPPLPISTVCRSVDNKQVGFFFVFCRGESIEQNRTFSDRDRNAWWTEPLQITDFRLTDRTGRGDSASYTWKTLHMARCVA